MGALDILGSKLAQYDLTEADYRRYLAEKLAQSGTDRAKAVKGGLEAFSGRGLAQSSGNLDNQVYTNQTFDEANANYQQDFQNKLRDILAGRITAQQEYDSTTLQEQLARAQAQANVTPNVPVQSEPITTPQQIAQQPTIAPKKTPAPQKASSRLTTATSRVSPPVVATAPKPKTPIAKVRVVRS